MPIDPQQCEAAPQLVALEFQVELAAGKLLCRLDAVFHVRAYGQMFLGREGLSAQPRIPAPHRVQARAWRDASGRQR
jgi:hypothetical protein